MSEVQSAVIASPDCGKVLLLTRPFANHFSVFLDEVPIPDEGLAARDTAEKKPTDPFEFLPPIEIKESIRDLLNGRGD